MNFQKALEKNSAMAAIRELVSGIEKQYKEFPERIVSDFETEERTKKEYATRQFFELLQNADDQAEASGIVDGKNNPILKNVRVKVEIKCNSLIVQNSGEPFSIDGIKSLMYPHFSPKKYLKDKKREMIGYKGLGFRSLLNWIGETGSIRIVTRNFTVSYSRQFANVKLDEILSAEDCSKNVQDEMSNIRVTEQYPIAVLTQPNVNCSSEYLDADFTTAIVVECDGETIAKIADEVKNLKFKELLFLKNIESVELYYSGTEKVITKISEYHAIHNHEIVLIEETINGKKTDYSEWYVYETSVGAISVFEKNKKIDKKYEIKIAYPQDKNIREDLCKDGVLYSFFQTDEKFPFPYILHATFELEGNRNRIEKNNKVNSELINKVVEFMCSTAARVAEYKDSPDYEALSLVLEQSKSDGTLFTKYNFSELLFEATKKLRLLPTISGEYLSANDSPQYEGNGFAGIVRPNDFDDLLQQTSDKKVASYLSDSRLALNFYSNDAAEVAKRIEASADKYNIIQKAKLVKLFADRFNSSNVAPHILLDKNGNIITEDSATVFINPRDDDEASIKIPVWSKSYFLDNEFEDLLFDEFGVKAPADLVAKIKPFKINRYRFESVLRGLISQAQDDNNKVTDVIESLYLHWSNNKKFAADISDIPIKAIDINGKAVDTNNLYFGDGWNNPIGEKILKHAAGIIYVGTAEQNNLQKHDMQSIDKFFDSLGIKKFPRIAYDTLCHAEKQKYFAYTNEPKKCWKYGNIDKNSNFEIEVLTIKGIAEILEGVSSNDILLWLHHDKELREHLSKSYESGRSTIRYDYGQKNYKKQYRELLSSDCMRSYLVMVFKNTAWVEITSGKKEQPSKLLIDDNLPKGFATFFAIPKPDIAYLSHNGCNQFTALSILAELGAVSSLKELDRELIFKALLDLPEKDLKQEIGGQIYHRINSAFQEKAELDNLLTGNMNYDKFLQEGKLLCSGGKGYVPVASTVYINNKVICDAIMQQLNAVKLPRRLGGPKIERLFGATHFKGVELDKITPVYSAKSIQADFEQQYNMLRPYIYAGRIDKDSKGINFRALKKIRIMLCDKIEILYNNQNFFLRDFENIYSLMESREKNIAYIKIPSDSRNYNELSSKTDFKISLAEIISAILDVENQDYYQLIIGMSEFDVRKTYLQSNTEENLKIAHAKFGREIDYESEFWDTLYNVTQISIDKLKVNYINVLGNEFNYSNLSGLLKEHEFQAIKYIFLELCIDIEDYNMHAYDKINLSSFYKYKYKQLKKQIEKFYYIYLYAQTKANGETYSLFLHKKAEFDLVDVPQFADSIRIDVSAILEDYLGISISELEGLEEIDINDEAGFAVPSVKDASVRLGDTGDADEAVFSKGIEYKKIFDESSHSQFETQLINPQKPTVQSGKRQQAGRTSSGRVPHELEKAKLENGYIGECAVYRYLWNEQVAGRIRAFKWVSGNASYAKQNENPNDKAGYDFEYTTDGLDKFYIEVKASGTSGDIEFSMSNNEIQWAQENPKCYKVFFVIIRDKIAMTPIKDLGCLFDFERGESWMLNSKFTIEQDGFKIRTKDGIL